VRSQPGPSKSPVKSRPFRARPAQTWPWSMLTGLIPSTVRQTRALRQPIRTRTGPRAVCSDSNARKRAHDSTTSHLTPAPTPARQPGCTADQMSCQFACWNTARGVQQRRIPLLSSCCPRRRRLAAGVWTSAGRVKHSSQLSGRLFCCAPQRVACRFQRHRLGSR
jgi:hypothetical protein